MVPADIVKFSGTSLLSLNAFGILGKLGALSGQREARMRTLSNFQRYLAGTGSVAMVAAAAVAGVATPAIAVGESAAAMSKTAAEPGALRDGVVQGRRGPTRVGLGDKNCPAGKRVRIIADSYGPVNVAWNSTPTGGFKLVSLPAVGDGGSVIKTVYTNENVIYDADIWTYSELGFLAWGLSCV